LQIEFTRGVRLELSPISRCLFNTKDKRMIMDAAPTIVFDLGWIFFITWGTVLAAVSAIAFGRDFFPPTDPPSTRT
jgi:hypothetical protein